MQTFGTFIRDRRRALGLTQRDVARALGLKSIAFLSDIEAGNRKPSRELLPNIARVLQTELDTLQSLDIRGPIVEVRSMLQAHPEYAVAFRRVIEHSRRLGAEEVLRRIETNTLPEPRNQPKAIMDEAPKSPRTDGELF
jgi:transcriptional regulator with XRE-family HTH domain